MGNLARFDERAPRRDPVAPDAVVPSDDAPVKEQKFKVRSAWISFASRILAQLIGAAATIGLGVVVMQQYAGSGPARVAAPPTIAASAPVTAPVATNQSVLAVLPIANFTGDPSRDAFADALTDAVIVALTNATGPRVVSRTSSMRYKNSTKSLPEIARELGVHLVVESSIAGQEDRMRVTVQLIDARTDHHMWAKTFDVTGRDLLGLQTDVATSIADAVQRTVIR